MKPKPLSESSLILVANGHPDAPPASGVRDYLAQHAARLVAIFHPLNPEDPPMHSVSEWRDGRLVGARSLQLPSRPPATYLLDAFAPLRRGRHDAWLAFSNLSALHGIVRRRARLVDSVAYWAVDFVPDRFGPRSRLTQVYDAVDRFAATRADLRVELTQAACSARSERLGLGPGAAATHVAPVGIWLDRIPSAPDDAYDEGRVVFVGHLVARQGVEALLRAVALVPELRLEIAGRGPEEERLRAVTRELELDSRVTFHGFLDDHREVERLVASATVAAAPYVDDPGSFTRYADPSKLRTYTGAGLPVVLTDVPPNARELAEEAGAELVADSPEAIAAGLRRVLASREEWRVRRSAARTYSARFDWREIVPRALERLGFEDR